MKKIYLALIFCTFIFFNGCTGGSKHPAHVTTYEILFKQKELNAHLDKKRKELNSMQKKASDLESILYQQKMKLKKANNKYYKKLSKNKEISFKEQNFQKQLIQKNKELEQLSGQLNSLKKEMNNLENKLSSTKKNNKKVIRENIARQKIEIEDLESEIALLERSINRILIVRAKHSLEK